MNERNEEESFAGKRFGKLIAVEPYHGDTNDYMCYCDCGEYLVATTWELENGTTTCCLACLAKK